MMPPTVDLVYLAWVPLGLGPFERFLAAHRAHPPGVAAQLVVVLSGGSSSAQLRPYRDRLHHAGLKYREIVRPGPGYDIAAYRATARTVTGEWICFLNSYSRPLAVGWLAHLLLPQWDDPGLRLTGAGGNHASAYWHLPPESSYGFSRIPLRGWLQRRRFRHHVARQQRDFPASRGPIIRTNAFALRREDFLRLRFPVIRTKYDTLLFESGWIGMTRQVLGAGHRVAVVDRHGAAHAPPDWPHSGTFASRDQENLLVADNRTDAYQEATATERVVMSRAVYTPPLSGLEPDRATPAGLGACSPC